MLEHRRPAEGVGHFGKTRLVLGEGRVVRAEFGVGSRVAEHFFIDRLAKGVVRQIGAGGFDGRAQKGALLCVGLALGFDQRQRRAQEQPRPLRVAAGGQRDDHGQRHRGVTDFRPRQRTARDEHRGPKESEPERPARGFHRHDQQGHEAECNEAAAGGEAARRRGDGHGGDEDAEEETFGDHLVLVVKHPRPDRR